MIHLPASVRVYLCLTAPPTYRARIIAITNRNPDIDVASRLIVTCRSMSSWKPNFSSMVATGNNPS
jgi:hypothetical protein